MTDLEVASTLGCLVAARVALEHDLATWQRSSLTLQPADRLGRHVYSMELVVDGDSARQDFSSLPSAPQSTCDRLIADAASALQDLVVEVGWRSTGHAVIWPACPTYPGSPLDPRIEPGRAAWRCPVDRSIVAEVGRL